MAKAKTHHLVLLRSGRTDWDQEGRLCGGGADLALCDAGRHDVDALVAELQATKLSVVLSGPDEASLETAQAIAKQTGAKVRKLEDLADLDLGLWQGLLAEDLEDRCPTAYKKWLDDPSAVSAPEGESLDEALGRVLKSLRRALEKVKEENALIGVVLRPMMHALLKSHLLKADLSGVWDMKCEASASERFDVLPGMLEAREPSTAPTGA